MVRKSIYASSFVFTLFSTILNLVSLSRVDWVIYKAPASSGAYLKTSWGLFEVCNYTASGQKQCRGFPKEGLDCTILVQNPDFTSWRRPFSLCDYYRTSGYAAQLAAVFGCAALISHIIIVARGRRFRNHGWKVLLGFILANAACQIVTTAFLVQMVRTRTNVFPVGSHVTTAFILSQVSWGTDILLFASLLAAGIIHSITGSPDGYREIPSTPPSRRSRRWSDDEDE
ncbi:MAG: hypothetical protein CYPHOPRED_004169 [Cyphobasidiales sp. Tagirdzhanova-0007]|nr:MAG: hypothetical protein CYPHOPRED_004169 [Cyphobasidiales sp. Tagirdzhanova-0007]